MKPFFLIVISLVLFFSHTIFANNQELDPLDTGDNNDPELFLDTFPAAPSPYVAYNYTPPFQNPQQVDQIIFEASVTLHRIFTLTDEEKAVINAYFEKPITELIDVNLLKNELIKLATQSNELLNQIRSRFNDLRERRKESRSRLESLHDTLGSDNSLLVDVIIQSQKENLDQFNFKLQSIVNGLEYTNIAVQVNLLKAVIVYTEKKVAVALAIDKTELNADIEQITKDIRYFLAQNITIQHLIAEIPHLIKNVTDHIRDLEHRIDDGPRTVPFETVSEVIKSNVDEANHRLRDDLIGLHPALVDAHVDVSVSANSITISVQLSVDMTLINTDVVPRFVRGAIAALLNVSIDNVHISADRSKKRNVFQFTVTITNNDSQDPSVITSSSIGLVIPTLTQEQRDKLKDLLPELQNWIKNLRSITEDELKMRLSYLQAELRSHMKEENDTENEFENSTKSVRDGRDSYEYRAEIVKASIGLDVKKAVLDVLENRYTKMVNTLQQFHACVVLSELRLTKAYVNLLKIKIRLIEQLLNNDTDLQINATVALINQVYLANLACNETAMLLSEKKKQLDDDYNNFIRQVADIKSKVVSQVKPKYEDVKAFVLSIKDTLKVWVKSDVEDALNDTECDAENIANQLDKYANMLYFNLILKSSKGVSEIKNAITAVIAASTGAPTTTITVEVTSNKKRTTSTVEAVVNLDSGSPVGTKAPNSATGLKVALSLILLAFSFMLLM